MHRIDTATAQIDKFGSGKNGFTRGNPQTGTLATTLDDDYLDSIQEEISGVIEAAGITLDKDNNAQLLAAILKLFIPSGDRGDFVAITGDTMTGPLLIQYDSAPLYIQPISDGQVSALIGKDSAGSQHWYVGKALGGSDDIYLANFKSGSRIILGADGSVAITASGGPVTLTGATGSALSLGQDGGVTITPAAGKSISLGGNTGVVGGVTPSDYSNFDARYLAISSGVTDIVSGVDVSVNSNVSATITAPSGCFLSGVTQQFDGVSPSTVAVLYKQLYKVVNGVTIPIQDQR